jgi:hypothetical protein
LFHESQNLLGAKPAGEISSRMRLRLEERKRQMDTKIEHKPVQEVDTTQEEGTQEGRGPTQSKKGVTKAKSQTKHDYAYKVDAVVLNKNPKEKKQDQKDAKILKKLLAELQNKEFEQKQKLE